MRFCRLPFEPRNIPHRVHCAACQSHWGRVERTPPVCRSALCSPLLSSCGILHVTILLCQNNLSLPCEVQTDTTYRQKGMNNFLRHKVVPLPQRRYPLRGLGPWVPLPTGEHHYSRSSAFEPDTGRRGLSTRPPCLGSTDGY